MAVMIRDARRATTGRMMARAGMAGLLVALVQGCAPQKVAPVSNTRYFQVDLQGAAANCTVSTVTAQAGKEVPAVMSVGNDGGWCALTIAAEGNKPYAAGLLTERPAHGTVLIHTVGDTTRIDYTPTRGYAGEDKFKTKLLPGDAVVAFSVTVLAK